MVFIPTSRGPKQDGHFSSGYGIFCWDDSHFSDEALHLHRDAKQVLMLSLSHDGGSMMPFVSRYCGFSVVREREKERKQKLNPTIIWLL